MIGAGTGLVWGVRAGKKELLGGSVITERLYIDVKQDLKKKEDREDFFYLFLVPVFAA